MLITEAHRLACYQLHQDPNYGTGSDKYLPRLTVLAQKYHAQHLLDYGCGKGTLKDRLGIPVRNYEPAFNVDEREPSDIVLVRNVLPNVEPECLLEVMKDIRWLTIKCAVFRVCTVWAPERLTVAPSLYWRELFREYSFRPAEEYITARKFYMVCEPC